MIKKEDCVELGYIAKAHGLKGEVKAVFDVHNIDEYRKVKTLFLAKKDADLKPFEVKRFDIKTDKMAYIRFKDFQYRDQAEDLTGSTIFFPLELLPELPEGHFYYFDVIGFKVQDQQLGDLGEVAEFISGPAHDILVMIYQGKEVLIPMTDKIVLRAEKDKALIITNLPEGLLDIYLE
jgi:16S rRNA processing protein RimM